MWFGNIGYGMMFIIGWRGKYWQHKSKLLPKLCLWSKVVSFGRTQPLSTVTGFCSWGICGNYFSQWLFCTWRRGYSEVSYRYAGIFGLVEMKSKKKKAFGCGDSEGGLWCRLHTLYTGVDYMHYYIKSCF